MPNVLPISMLQLPSNPSLDDFEARVKGVMETFPATELVIFPELHLTSAADGFAETGPESERNEPIDGPRSQRLGEIARRFGVWLIPGSVLERDGDSIYNTLPVYSPEGDLVTSYRKIFPWRPFEKSRPGNQIVSFDIPGRCRVGLTICYDAWFPEIHRQLAWDGCDVIINVVHTSTIDREQELVLARANAIVNQVYLVSLNAGAPSAVGQSMVVDPEGRVRSRSVGAEPCVITDVLNLDAVELVRTHGTAGLNCLWNQFELGGDPIDLPIYGGRITPDTWKPRAR